MQLYVDWLTPVPMRSSDTLILTTDFAVLPQSPGVYIFCRKWGKQSEALYVGRAENIRSRVRQQTNNLKLMKHIANAAIGQRQIIAGCFLPKPGQPLTKCLDLIERALIRHFLSEGHNLVNKVGAKLWEHEIDSTGQFKMGGVPKKMLTRK